MALAAVQGQTATTSAHESLLYSLISDDQLVQGPLDAAAYAQTDSTGTTTNRLAAVGGDSIDDITATDPEVGLSNVLGGNVLVANQNPLNGEAATTEQAQQQPSKPAPSLYTVKAGDTIASIADQFNISTLTLTSANGVSKADTIRPGDVLTVLPVNGVLYKVRAGDTLSEIANKYDVNASDISSYNQLGTDNKLALDAKLIIPGAQPPQVQVQASHTLADASSPNDSTPTDQPDPTPAPVSGGKMAWPTISSHISQYFKWGHTGIDIDNRGAKVPIKAAADGVVEKAGWMGGYGNLTVLRHADGKETYYGHQKKFYVEVGDHVTQGQVIGEMGSTGHSTGPHVHFEVRIGGKPVNPLAYL